MSTILKQIKNKYGTITIEDTVINNEPIRLYRHNDGLFSATFLNDNKKYDIVFGYPKQYEIAFNFFNIQKLLMIGGAGYQYPKYYISHHSGTIDIVDIDPISEIIAKQWFFLDDLYKDYNLDNTHRFNTIIEDARIYLKKTDNKYDAIFNDAFFGTQSVLTLATKEANIDIKAHLNYNGIYMTNIAGQVYGPKSQIFKSIIATIQSVFTYVYILPCNDKGKQGYTETNYMILATDQNIKITNNIPYYVNKTDKILTDQNIKEID